MEVPNSPSSIGGPFSAYVPRPVRPVATSRAASRPAVSRGTIGSPAVKTSSVAFVSSYPPQQCGIATFTEDLLQAVVGNSVAARHGVVVVGDDLDAMPFPDEVVGRIRKDDRADYLAAAHLLNASCYDVVCIQHEFGLFGGAEGEYLLDLLYTLRKPVITTLHTVQANPTENYRQRTIEVANASDGLVVLTPKAIELLRDVYGISPAKVAYIAHGIPDIEYCEPNRHKQAFGLEGRTVIMTFGLIGPSKGIEQMIEAMPAIAEKHPDVLYLIVGATHPGILRSQGERYRESLQAKVGALGLEENIAFQNRYLEDDEVCEYLKSCDIYVTPYLSRDQISSGTLSYAAGVGRAIVSTGYWYAQDLLGCGRGKLVDFDSPAALANAINFLIEHPEERAAMGRRAYAYSRCMTWSNVASDYINLFHEMR